MLDSIQQQLAARKARRRRFDPLLVVGGLATVLLHAGAFGMVFYFKRAQAAPPPLQEKYVVARLVRLGKKKNPKHLPDKVMPTRATVPKKTVDLSAKAEDKPQPKPKEEKPEQADTSDRMRRALDMARDLSDAQREADLEGDPNGSLAGTATRGNAGDAYITRIADLWNRTWSLPSIIPPDEAQQLYVLVVIRIDETGQVQVPIDLQKPSGNQHFDGSVKNAWRRIGKLPLPPPDRLTAILANGLALKLTWKGMQ